MKRNDSSWYKSLGVSLLCFVFVALSFGQAGETLSLYTAIRDNKVSVKVTGAGMERITGTVTRLEGIKPLKVGIPIGTLFVAASGDVQDMVALNPTTIDLTRTTTATFSVAVACTNMDREEPSDLDEFTVEASPKQPELQKLLEASNRMGRSPEEVQDAVWIITDNAKYADLVDAAGAMMLMDRAKLDLKKRAIWRERVKICRDVLKTPDDASSEVRLWCNKILRGTRR